LIHVLPPFADIAKYDLHIHAWSLFYMMIRNAHMLLPLKVLSTNICAWSFYFEFDYFCSKAKFGCFNFFHLHVCLW
jgi:hypothetical protein